jgi:hypothetical protein
MPRRPPFRVLIALVGVIVMPSSAPASPTVQPFKVTSSIDGKKVLPLRTRWLAYPKTPMAKTISKVEFLIDGRLRCVERFAPYNYGSDDLHGHIGYLVTTWLSPGLHRFTAKAVLTNGRHASNTVVARAYPMAPVILKFLLTKTWCGQLILIMWTAYEPSLSFSTRLTVPPGYLATAAALALFAAAPVMIVPIPGRQFCGT